MHERFRYQHQDAIGPSAQQQTMQDQTRFDCFSQSHFIRQHHAWGVTVGDLMCDVKLMRNQINAAAAESAHRRFSGTVLQFQRAPTQQKRRRSVKPPCDQTLLWSLQTDTVANLGFGQALAIVDVNQQAMLLNDFLDDELMVRLRSYGVANAKAHALQRCLVNRISPRFASSAEHDLHPASSGLHDRAQPKFWLRFADPPLTWNEHTHEFGSAPAGPWRHRKSITPSCCGSAPP